MPRMTTPKTKAEAATRSSSTEQATHHEHGGHNATRSDPNGKTLAEAPTAAPEAATPVIATGNCATECGKPQGRPSTGRAVGHAASAGWQLRQ